VAPRRAAVDAALLEEHDMPTSRTEPTLDVVTTEIEIAAPPERVFVALTDARQLFTWWGKETSVELLSFDMDPRLGGRWSFRCRPTVGTEQGPVGEQLARNGAAEYEVHGTVLEFAPPRLLVWSWIANWHEKPERETIVRWELRPTTAGTLVRVSHSGLVPQSVERKDYPEGWAAVLKLLQAYLS
jgi:uncharacterized protein YndB with AHSA1/START domain